MEKTFENGIKPEIKPKVETAKELYGDLFKALFKIPDQNMQRRILDAINGKCDKCELLKKDTISDFQTKFDSKENIINEIDKQDIFKKSILRNFNKSTQTSKSDYIISTLTKKEVEERNNISKIRSGKEVKLGRSKRVNIPHVKKTIQLADPDKSLKNTKYNKIQKNFKKHIPLPQPTETKEVIESIKEESLDVEAFLTNNMKSLENDFLLELTPTDVEQEMLKDWHMCTEPIDEEGYLPIHNAAQLSDIIVLKHQCMVLKHRFGNIDIVTNFGETPLHIAIVFNSGKDIIEMLLEFGSNILKTNDEGNNALHLCALYSENIEIFQILLKHIKLDILDTYNFEGFAVLHILVFEKKVNFIRALLLHIDEILNIKSIGQYVDGDALNEQLQDFISSFTAETKPIIDLNNQKMKIINQKCMKCGRTPLFIAVSTAHETMSFILMANGADPRIEDLSGTECFSLSTDIISNKLIATAVYNSSFYLKHVALENDEKRIEKSKILFEKLRTKRLNEEKILEIKKNEDSNSSDDQIDGQTMPILSSSLLRLRKLPRSSKLAKVKTLKRKVIDVKVDTQIHPLMPTRTYAGKSKKKK